MDPITTVAEMDAQRESMVGTVGLVPTMGFLHEGHLSLVRRALADCDHVVVSIFVNPTQFGPNEDFGRYPRDERRDLALLEETLSTHRSTLSIRHSALAFVPTADEMYPPGFDDWVEIKGPITERLEGAHRRGHFRGVTTVCARLFRIVRPHRAYFGQKDAQQLRVIRRMVVEQRLPVEIVPMPTVREPDGLALSSRNVYLSAQQRRAALVLPRALALARDMVATGITDAEAIRRAVRDYRSQGVRLSSENRWGTESRPAASLASEDGPASQPDQQATTPRLTLEYISVSDEDTLEELETIDRPALVLLAARIGRTRLIDNAIVVPRGMTVPDELRELVEADAVHLPNHNH